MKETKEEILNDHFMPENFKEYRVKVIDYSVERARGKVYQYLIKYYVVLKRKFLWVEYESEKEFDCLLFKQRKLNSEYINYIESCTGSFFELEEKARSLGLTSSNRVATVHDSLHW